MTSIKTFSVPYRIHREDVQALMIDVQVKLLPHIHEHEAALAKMAILIQGLQALNVPIMLNEQYKKGLGETVPALYELLNEANRVSFEKTSFSVCDNPPSWEHIAKQNRQIALIFGVEAHVCVLQTVLDLLDSGIQPVVIADAVSSRNPYDKKIALRRMRRVGAVITTTEAILFELCRDAKDPAFKTISNLVK